MDTPEAHPKRRKGRKASGPRALRYPGRPKPAGVTTERLVDLTLTARHGINGISYGPGPVRVPEGVAAVLREQETRRHRERDKFYDTNRAFIIGRGLRAHAVPYETFEDTYRAAAPVGEVSGRTLKASF